MINLRFPTHFAPDQDAFERLSRPVSDRLPAAWFRRFRRLDGPDRCRGFSARCRYLDHLAAVAWIEEEVQRTTHSPHLGAWTRHFEWGLLRYLRDVRFALLHPRVHRALTALASKA